MTTGNRRVPDIGAESSQDFQAIHPRQLQVQKNDRGAIRQERMRPSRIGNPTLPGHPRQRPDHW